MYLYGVRSPANLGYYQRAGAGQGLGRLGFRPNQAVQRGVYRQKRPVNNGLRGYRGIGQDESDLFDTSLPMTGTSSFQDISALDSVPATSGFLPSVPYGSAGNLTITPADYTSTPGGTANSPDFAALQAQITPVSNITDYVSPAAAIAAGAPAAQVNAIWATSQGVNSFSSPSAATAALTASMGAAQAAAAVAKLWAGGGQPAPTASSSLLTGSIGGIPTTLLLGGGALILLLGLMSGGRR
jgi:hypothetical protein